MANTIVYIPFTMMVQMKAKSGHFSWLSTPVSPRPLDHTETAPTVSPRQAPSPYLHQLLLSHQSCPGAAHIRTTSTSAPAVPPGHLLQKTLWPSPLELQPSHQNSPGMVSLRNPWPVPASVPAVLAQSAQNHLTYIYCSFSPPTRVLPT